jgi:FkbM family methyltransferase
MNLELPFSFTMLQFQQGYSVLLYIKAFFIWLRQFCDLSKTGPCICISPPGFVECIFYSLSESKFFCVSLPTRRDYQNAILILSRDSYGLSRGSLSEAVSEISCIIKNASLVPLVLDLGANVGLFPIMLSFRIGEIKHILVEPEHQNFCTLRKNLYSNFPGLEPVFVNCAIADSDRMVVLCGKASNSDAYRLRELTGTKKGEDFTNIIQATSVDSIIERNLPLISEYSPFIAKIDIEGAESLLQESNASVLRLFPIILFEPHDWMMTSKTPPLCCKLLRLLFMDERRIFVLDDSIALVRSCTAFQASSLIGLK